MQTPALAGTHPKVQAARDNRMDNITRTGIGGGSHRPSSWVGDRWSNGAAGQHLNNEPHYECTKSRPYVQIHHWQIHQWQIHHWQIHQKYLHLMACESGTGSSQLNSIRFGMPGSTVTLRRCVN
jgi:hypothetical protein